MCTPNIPLHIFLTLVSPVALRRNPLVSIPAPSETICVVAQGGRCGSGRSTGQSIIAPFSLVQGAILDDRTVFVSRDSVQNSSSDTRKKKRAWLGKPSYNLPGIVA